MTGPLLDAVFYADAPIWRRPFAAHVKAWERHVRIRAEAARQWDAMPDFVNARDHARAHLAAMPADRRAMLNAEWEIPRLLREANGERL